MLGSSSCNEYYFLTNEMTPFNAIFSHSCFVLDLAFLPDLDLPLPEMIELVDPGLDCLQSLSVDLDYHHLFVCQS